MNKSFVPLMRSLLLLFVGLAFVPAIRAQDAKILGERHLRFIEKQDDAPRVEIRHTTMELLSSVEGKAALAEYGRLKAEGLLPYARKGGSFDIGEKKVFTVRILDSQSGAWDAIEFTKKAEEALFDLWVETAELQNGRVTDQDVENMRLAFDSQTPPLSVDPSSGIIANDQNVFGPPPNVDGDFKLDVLVMDIRDGWDPDVGGGFTLGFYDPVNLTGQNMADIIHLDSYPGITDPNGAKYRFGLPQQILAHEYQHLIYSTVNKGVDVAFTNEGLSTWAEMINGYFPPITGGADYLRFSDEWTRPLMDWRAGGGPDLEDYQRGGLFTSYLAHRIGVEATGEIARTVFFGAEAYQAVVTAAGLDFRDLIAEFHVANAINNLSLGEAYGHTSPQYQSQLVPFIPIINGEASNSTAKITQGIGQGGVQYMIWENVGDFRLRLTEENGRPGLIQPMVILEREVGPPEIQEVEISLEGAFFDGNFTRITLVIPHTDILDWDPNAVPQDPSPPRALVGYTADWEDFVSSVQVENLVYDTGQVAIMNVEIDGVPRMINALSISPSAMKANRFNVPPGGILTTVMVDQPYETDLGNPNVPQNAPRDFDLIVWDENGSGVPGTELFSTPVADVSSAGIQSFEFMTINLDAFSGQLSNLPDVIFIGVRNRGTDENYFHMTISEYAAAGSPSYIFDTNLGGWSPFSELCVFSCDDVDLDNFVLPIRASFVIDNTVTDVQDDPFDVPTRITLEQNYPNPFNPVTSIRFTVPTSSEVSLRVFDLLGRQIDELVNDLLPSGEHEVQFDASSLASGIYIYTLESGSESHTRTMTLLK